MYDGMRAYTLAEGEMIKAGDIIVDFRGDKWIYVSVIPDGNSHKIYARKPNQDNSYRLFFPSVFRLEVR
jgi:ribosomal protein L27